MITAATASWRRRSSALAVSVFPVHRRGRASGRASAALPTDQRQLMRRVQQPHLPGLESVVRQNLLGTLGWDLGKYRTAARQPNARRSCQVEHVEHAKEQTEHIGSADDADAGFRFLQGGQSCI